MTFQHRTIFITGGSRGIGEAIALKLAAAGANIVIAAKSVEEDPRLGGTIFSVAAAVEKAGGKALPIQVDIRDEAQIQAAVQQAADKFGGIDVLINNASAIQLTNTEQTPAKRFDLMYDINVRGTFLVTQHCIPYLKKGTNPHILTLSPPVNIAPQWLGAHVAYTISKYNMSLLALGWAEELKQYGVAANSLWPATTIATAAVRNLLGGEALINRSRKPEIIADAVSYILSRPSATCTGNNFIDEEVLKAAGITDLEKYAVTPGGKLQADLFL
ncbi:citronellol/citronellal dehydrogenase [Chitinophaga niastensis]|uniref:Citronellol/citronellal dehydrogenase n=1 Tax=Chitinophaga niastensis TaxID=536980 RepID=A0A2P8HDR4_CHINA|nr:NAD(P)-dependent oxidoreductase [Chitinophaga niastensis]PSL44364.1 citronellol/citronellal dehydrogenase [Chitinophaga niastensis]